MKFDGLSAFLLPFLTATTWFPHAVAAGDALSTYEACRLSLGGVHFDDLGPEPPKLNETCQSRLSIESHYLCLKVYGPDNADWSARLGPQNETCQLYLNTSLPPFSIVEDYSDEKISQLKRVELEDREAGVVSGEVVLVSERLYHAASGTLDSVDYVYSHHYAYGWAMGVFWIVVIVAGLLSRAFSKMCEGRRTASGLGESVPGIFGAVDRWVKRRISTPATFGYRCSQNLGWCTIPPRVQSLTILVFIVMNVFFCIHGYRLVSDNLYFPTIEKQVLRYVSDRTGVISFANFPIIWLFGMRNNLLMWLTGWDFGTYNNFHRWVARVATLQAVVHSIGYTVLIVKMGSWANFLQWWYLTFFWAGELATIFMCLILGFSVYWIRRKHYEIFLILHIALSVLMLITMVLHVSIFKARYDLLAWGPAAIWVLDRVLRMSRTLSFNLKFWDTWASASFDPDSNMVRLVVPCGTSFYRPEPGTYYYLHVLSDSRFWESHPFTMAYSTGLQRRQSKDSTEDTPLMAQNDDISLAMSSPQGDPSMTFLIRPYDSSTSRLRDAAAAMWPSPTSLRVLVEGPYGHTQPFADFENLLFVVGGSGIVVPLAYLATLAASPRVKSVRIVWVVRERGFAQDVLERDFGPMVGHEKISIKICLTHQDDVSSSGALSELPKDVSVQLRRPDARDEVEMAADAVGSQSLAVVACGPARMADETRRAVVDTMRDTGPRLEYFEESFKW